MHTDALSRRAVFGLIAGAAALPALSAHAGSPVISRGFNIPLWLDVEPDASVPPADDVLAFLRRVGFETVRLPFDPAPFFSPGAAANAMTARMANALDTLLGHGFTVTLDMHPLGATAAALEDDIRLEDALDGAWATVGTLARTYAPQSVFLELLNEPPLWQNRWLPLRDRLAHRVREAAPDHVIIWGANRFQSIDETLDCPPLDMPNTIAAVHYYTPMALTHRCQNWGTQAAATPSSSSSLDWSAEEIAADFSRLRTWSRQHGTPVILNEFGVFGACVDSDARTAWTAAVRTAARDAGIGWTYWEFDRGFGFISDRTRISHVDDKLLKALVGALG